ncbi:hypothetical protein [Gracilimonas sediminicola]|uniref:Uncharacterized protein n=1 Tax=Gracilimonas sediminicola TaxID=2952158 RepID=A0A9X2L1L5_9BACT|nr:hypothetical protein [Gracilimonas sediminicola]MCP9290569.1 hypothetical protein [Gracilimonas sediminicola]
MIYKLKDIPQRGTPLKDEDITLELAEKCQRIVAELVVSEGRKYLPLFERVTSELEKLKEQDRLLKLAHQIAS